MGEQQEIVRRVAGMFALADQLEQRLTQAHGYPRPTRRSAEHVG